MDDLVKLGKDMLTNMSEYTQKYQDVVTLEFLCVPREKDSKVYVNREKLKEKQVLLKTSVEALEQEKHIQNNKITIK